MIRFIALILIASFAAYANADLAGISDSHSPPEMRNFPDRPEKTDPPELNGGTSSPPGYADPSIFISGTPRQEMLIVDTIELQTSDNCDSADTVRFTIPETVKDKD